MGQGACRVGGAGVRLPIRKLKVRLYVRCDRVHGLSRGHSYIQVVSIIINDSEITRATMIGQDPEVAIPERIVWDMLKQEITET